jgi:hypothetical protein
MTKTALHGGAACFSMFPSKAGHLDNEISQCFEAGQGIWIFLCFGVWTPLFDVSSFMNFLWALA